MGRDTTEKCCWLETRKNDDTTTGMKCRRHMAKWTRIMERPNDDADIVLSTRVRLARNLQSYAFGPRARVNDREAVLRQFKESIARSDSLKQGTLLELPDVPARTRRILLERRLVTRDLLGDDESGPPRGTAVHLSDLDSVTVMVNEEDHLRVQSLMPGLRIEEAWRLVDELDEALSLVN